MSLLLINLEHADALSDVLLALTQVGVQSPVLLEGEAGANKMSQAVPIFAGLVEGFGRQEEYVQLILAPIAGPEVAAQFVRALADGGIDWHGEKLGWMVVVPTEPVPGADGA